jgi:hypothetical protein
MARFYIQDFDGNSIPNARIETFVIGGNGKRKEFNPASFSFKNGFYQVYLGLELRGDFLFRIAAEGFETTERQVNFPRGVIQNFVLGLKRKGTSEPEIFGKLPYISGFVKDLDGRAVPKARVVFRGKENKTFETTTDLKGFYYIELKPDVYNLEVYAEGFKVQKIENRKIDLKDKQNLDVTLQIQEFIEHSPKLLGVKK